MEFLRPSEAELRISDFASCENGFSRFTRKRKVVELRVVISANIKSGIAVILSQNLSLYDLQKPRYDFTLFRDFVRSEIADFGDFPYLIILPPYGNRL